MTALALTPAQANLELTLLNAEAEALSSSDIYAWLRDAGLPSEAAVRLKGLVEITAEVWDRTVNVGKIVLIKIIEFVKVHPNLAIGTAIGAAIGAIVSAVPFFGAYLAPVVTMLGAMAGHRLDKAANGQAQNASMDLIAISQDVIEIAIAFFKLLSDIFSATLDTPTSRRV